MSSSESSLGFESIGMWSAPCNPLTSVPGFHDAIRRWNSADHDASSSATTHTRLTAPYRSAVSTAPFISASSRNHRDGLTAAIARVRSSGGLS